MITQKQAWIKIAEAFDASRFENFIARFGLCYAVNEISEEISTATYNAMHRQIETYRRKNFITCLFFWPTSTDEGRVCRANLAREFAAESPD